MAVTVRMACGCQIDVSDLDVAPHCEVHDERRVQSVNAPPPRFTAIDCTASGPLVTVKE